MTDINYKREIRKVYPNAEIHHTATIIGGTTRCYHVCYIADYVYHAIANSTDFVTDENKQDAWKMAYNKLKSEGKL